MKWYETLEDADQEKLFAGMRKIDEVLVTLHSEHAKLRPHSGQIPVGGAHMDSFFKIEGLESFLRGLREGLGIKESAEVAYEASRFAVRKWNKSREYQVHRWEDTAIAFIQNQVDRLQKLMEMELVR